MAPTRAACLAVVIALTGCERAGGGDAPVAVVLAPDEAGRLRLFTVEPGRSPRSVEATEAFELSEGVVSWGGAALALRVIGDRGAQLRWLRVSDGRFEPVPGMNGPFARTPIGISDDGAVVVARIGDDFEMARDGATFGVEVDGAGELMYGAALSGDGRRLAYSTMRRTCMATPEGMGTCPVTLWVAELDGSAPRAIAGGGAGDVVAYDPHFVDAAGSKLLYQTNRDDDSEACRGHVNACRYTVHEARADGSDDRQVLDDAVLARLSGDGALSYRVNGPSGVGGARSWFDQTLFAGPPGQPARSLGAVHLGVDRWSPDGRYLLVESGRDTALLFARDGTPAGAPLTSPQLRVLGWLRRGLRTGGHTVQVQRSPLEQGVLDARTRTGAVEQVALYRSAETSTGLLPPPPRLTSRIEVEAFLAERAGRQVVVARADYCEHQRDQPLAGGIVDASTGHVTLALPAPTPPRLDAPALARFDAVAAGGGELALIAVELPATARRGDRVPVTLWWRVEQPAVHSWTVFAHFDGGGLRFSGDHEVAVCGELAESSVGTVFQDSFLAEVGPAISDGHYELFIGWFRGGTRADITAGPDDGTDRARVGSIAIAQ